MSGGRRASEREILAALVRLVAQWSSSDVQLELARGVGVRLDPTAIRAVYALGLAGGSVRPGSLADHLHLSRPTTSKLIARLMNEGLVDRLPDVGDRRSAEVRLTDTGLSAFDRLVTAGDRLVTAALSGWAPADVAAFRDRLLAFVEKMPAPRGSATASSFPGIDQRREK